MTDETLSRRPVLARRATAQFAGTKLDRVGPVALRNGPVLTSRSNVERAAERHEDRSHAGAWERGFVKRAAERHSGQFPRREVVIFSILVLK